MNKLLVVGALLSTFFCGYADPVPPAGTFQRRVAFTVSEGLSSGVTDVPALVRISTAISGFSYADCDSANIVFADVDGNVLPHEIDTWDASGESLVWVKLPSVAADAKVWMYFKGVPAAENEPSGVWSSYTGVWHLNAIDTSDTTTKSQGLYSNSTATAGIDAHLARTYSTPGTDGKFGKSFLVNQTTVIHANDYKKGGVWVADSGADSPLDGDGVFTVSGWFKHKDYSGNDYHYDHPFAKRGKTKNTGSALTGSFAIEWNSAYNGTPIKQVNIAGASDIYYTPTYPDFAQDWTYLTYVFNGETVTAYYNGAKVGSGTITKATDNNEPLVFGNTSLILTSDDDSGDAAWGGWIDEVRYVNKVAMTDDQVAAEYAAMASSSFLAAGEVEILAESKVANPVFSPEAGIFISSVSVSLSTTTQGATIRYTTDGSEPTDSSEVYSEPLALTATTTIKAVGFKDGLEASDTVTATYTYMDPPPPSYTLSVQCEQTAGTHGEFPLTVTTNWLDAAFHDVCPGGIITDANRSAVLALLNAADSGNGLAHVWQNYVLGVLPGDAAGCFWLKAEQHADASTLRFAATNYQVTAGCGFDVRYRLVARDPDDEFDRSGEYASAASFDVDISSDTVKHRAIDLIFIPDGSATSDEYVMSVNIAGVMKAAAANLADIVTVPWSGFSPSGVVPVKAVDYVKSSCLGTGDLLYVYDRTGDYFYAWSVESDGSWSSVVTYKLVNGVPQKISGPAPDSALLKSRGDAVWIQRENPDSPIFLFGQYASTRAVTSLQPGSNLVGAPASEAFDVGSLPAPANAGSDGDRITVPVAGKLVNGFYDTAANAWTWSDETFDPVLPAGTGFWYVNSGSDAFNLTWPTRITDPNYIGRVVFPLNAAPYISVTNSVSGNMQLYYEDQYGNKLSNWYTVGVAK